MPQSMEAAMESEALVMHDNTYLAEILSQPRSLHSLLNQWDTKLIASISQSFNAGDFDRVILTGMGASFYSLYPASLILGRLGLPVICMDTSELIHYAARLISPRTALWVVSQSGESAEVTALVERTSRMPPAVLLACVNELNSPLAMAATCAVPLSAEPEQAVSTRTYLNALALTQLLALSIVGENLDAPISDLSSFVIDLQTYLDNWQMHLNCMAEAIGTPTYLAIVGRGPSLAAARSGALVLQEAAKFPALAFQAAQFRHGPLEIASEHPTILLFAGPSETEDLNRRLFDDLLQMNLDAFWLECGSPSRSFSEINPARALKAYVELPAARGISVPLAEAIPMQLFSLYLAQARGFEPGKFIRITKVTRTE